MSEKVSYQMKNTWLGWRSSEECEGFKFEEFGNERREKLSREIEGNEWEIARCLYIEKSQSSIDRKLSRAIEDLTRGFLSKEARWIEVAIEKLSRRQKVSRWIELAIESYRECNKK